MFCYLVNTLSTWLVILMFSSIEQKISNWLIRCNYPIHNNLVRNCLPKSKFVLAAKQNRSWIHYFFYWVVLCALDVVESLHCVIKPVGMVLDGYWTSITQIHLGSVFKLKAAPLNLVQFSLPQHYDPSLITEIIKMLGQTFMKANTCQMHKSSLPLVHWIDLNITWEIWVISDRKIQGVEEEWEIDWLLQLGLLVPWFTEGTRWGSIWDVRFQLLTQCFKPQVLMRLQ